MLAYFWIVATRGLIRKFVDFLRIAFTNQNSREAPLQLHAAVLMGSNFENEPTELMEKFLAPREGGGNGEEEGLYPNFYNTKSGTTSLLGLLIQEVQPKIVLETGVANAVSTRKILQSFSDSGLPNAQLYSCDIDKRVATQDLINNPQFNFRLIRSKRDFANLVSGLECLVLFYHDSDHAYYHQMYEYSEVWKKLRSGGLLVSDDINWSNAFLDFCKKVARTPYILSDTEKFSGFIQK
jgi:predicted O-methyltransferase YrrM